MSQLQYIEKVNEEQIAKCICEERVHGLRRREDQKKKGMMEQNESEPQNKTKQKRTKSLKDKINILNSVWTW